MIKCKITEPFSIKQWLLLMSGMVKAKICIRAKIICFCTSNQKILKFIPQTIYWMRTEAEWQVCLKAEVRIFTAPRFSLKLLQQIRNLNPNAQSYHGLFPKIHLKPHSFLIILYKHRCKWLKNQNTIFQTWISRKVISFGCIRVKTNQWFNTRKVKLQQS